MSNRLVEFDYFRGVAIFLVVWGHMTILLGEHSFVMRDLALLTKFITLTVQGATAFFVFISGFMFYWVYYRRGFRYEAFMRSKLNNVFRPYFFLATIFSLIHILYGVYSLRLAYWNFWVENDIERFFFDSYMYWSFWYVPFIAVVFFLSPVYLRFIKTLREGQVIILFCALIMSCLLGRNNTNPIHSCAYFSLYYLFGIFCAQNYERIKNFSLKFWLRLLWLYLMIILFATVACKFDYSLLHLYVPFITEGFMIWDFTPIFKVPECLLLLWIFENLAKRSDVLKKHLSIMAEYSFAIFFMHNFFIAIFEEVVFWANCEYPLQNTAWLYVVGFVMAILVCKMCIILAAFLKKKIGKDSRIYIGV